MSNKIKCDVRDNKVYYFYIVCMIRILNTLAEAADIVQETTAKLLWNEYMHGRSWN